MKPVIFALVPELDGTVEIYHRMDQNTRVRTAIKRPYDHAFLRQTIWDPEKQKNETIRLKLNCNTIYQEAQIKEHGILANEDFTAAEKRAVEFRGGINVVKNTVVYEYMTKNPQFVGSKCESTDIHGNKKMYYVIDKSNDEKIKNKETKMRVACANKIYSLSETEASDLMVRLNGTFYDTSELELEEKQNKLMEYLDDTDEAGMQRILEDKIEPVDELVLLVGELEAKEIISFNRKDDYVVLKKSGRDLDILKITSLMPLPERQRKFIEYLNSDAGLLALNELKNMQADLKEIASLEDDQVKAKTNKKTKE